MDPADIVRRTAERLLNEGDTPPEVPGAPSAGTPTFAEPTEPREPLPPKGDQAAPADTRHQEGAFLTTSAGARIRDTDHSLKAGERGPTLLQDHHLREKITHFDHERIPERVVHARGAGAHGVFVGYGTAETVTSAAFLGKDVETPVFTRFSTVLGNRGSADTVRDTRGFATKFYTAEGNFDLVANNIPVFFIQDGIKFPDVVHAAKPHPDRDIPQAQSAHDTFWDFVTLHTEAQHHTMWNMSDRGIPRSYRMMEGFGVHTFRLTNAEGATSLVKFHWKPMLGVHSLVWEEAQMLAGIDPDYHRRDLADAIESGAYPSWELGIQVMPDTPDQFFEGIDLLDATKIVPEELAPVQPIGRLTLHRNTTNFFAESEQIAFHVGHLVPGIDVTDDPLLQTRLFSYVDTQLSRLGGPNYNQIPINRPHAPVNDMFREGLHQHTVHAGVAPYRPNSLDGGCPFLPGATDRPFVEVPVELPPARKTRDLPASFDDHLSQVRMFWHSLTPVEQQHTINAYTFELGKCFEQAIKERQVALLAEIDRRLAESVAAGLGLAVPASAPETPTLTSPAVSQVGKEWPVDGRMVGIVVDPDDTEALAALEGIRTSLRGKGVLPLIIASRGGMLADGVPVQRTFDTARSVEFDALVVLSAPARAATAAFDARDLAETSSPLDPRVRLLVEECFRHAKGIVGLGAGADLLRSFRLEQSPGVVAATSADRVTEEVLALLTKHRVWAREEGSAA